MEVYVVLGGDGCAVERRGLVVPAAKSGFDLFVDAVADRLHDLGFDDVALGVDRHLNDDISLPSPAAARRGPREDPDTRPDMRHGLHGR